MSSTGWNCEHESNDNHGYSSDRVTCTYTTNNGTSYGGFVSNDSYHGGHEGYGAGISLGYSFK